jgi:CDP-glucose 4,6-dehydratase
MDNMGIESMYSVFKGKRVLVTGDTGFKGSWLSLWLNILGADVVGFALPPYQKEDHFNALSLDQIIHHIDGDIRDFDKVQKIFNAFQPEVLFHLAAQAIVRISYEKPKLTYDTNIGGSINILEAVRHTNSIRSVIYVTSDKCYRNKEWIWGYRENDELGGHDPYSSSKAAAELVFSAYMDSFFRERANLGAATVRSGNVIGGGDWSSDRILPDCIRALNDKRPIVLRNPAATRPWQHVLEPLSGYLLLAERLYQYHSKYSGSYNFGPENGAFHTVKDLAEEVVKLWGSGDIQIKEECDHHLEAKMLHLNIDKAVLLLGWKPKWDFYHAVQKTVNWYKEFSTGKCALELSKSQIQDYMEESYD